MEPMGMVMVPGMVSYAMRSGSLPISTKRQASMVQTATIYSSCTSVPEGPSTKTTYTAQTRTYIAPTLTRKGLGFRVDHLVRGERMSGFRSFGVREVA